MSTLDQLSWLSDYGDVQEHEPLARHTTMHVGGPARWFIRLHERERLLALLTRLEAERIHWYVLGGGSNTIAADAGLDAVVLQPQLLGRECDSSGVVSAEAGVITALFARMVTEAGYTGWEWGVGLPGTIGGAIVGNAGCFGGETADYLEEVEAWSKKTGRVEQYTKASAEFRYRQSLFKREPHVILRAKWRVLRAEDVTVSRARMQEILAERKAHQPLGRASAGCLFTNTVATLEQIEGVEAQLGERVPESARLRGHIPTGWILDRLGYKGVRCGSIRLSALHANFLLPDDHGSSQDILALRDRLQREVFERTGVRLVPEVCVLEDEAPMLH